jgi:tRNA threonylcarbamoyladenosine biosynthesis protein TsaB
MILVINTADAEQVYIGLVSGNKLVINKQFPAKYRQAEELLPRIDKLLKGQKIKLKDLKAISVVSGPGPFTALRIGITIANTLAWALAIPIFSIILTEFDNKDQLIKIIQQKFRAGKAGKIIEPYYGKEPNITIKK